MNIVTVCGMGFGTSLMMLMEIKKIASQAGFDVNGEACDLGTAKGKNCDLIVTSEELMDKMEGQNIPVVGVKNLIDNEEIKMKVLPHIVEYFNKQ